MTLSADEFVEHFDFTNPGFADLSPEFMFEVYARLRSLGPVAYGENKYPHHPLPLSRRAGGEWHVIGYEHVYECARDTGRLSSAIYGSSVDGHPQPLVGSVIQLDPPEQTNYKKALNPYFSPGRIRDLETIAREIADRHIDEFIADGHGDLADIAWRVPGTLLFREMLGFPVDDVNEVLAMVDRYMHPEFYGEQDPMSRSADMYAYCHQRLHERRGTVTSQQHDVLDHLLKAEVGGRELSFEAVVANAFLLVIAGLETTSNALTNSFVWLAEHPEQRRRLIEDPELMPKAIEEFVRHSGSIHGLPRIAQEDVEIGGCPVKQGEVVVLNWAAANRDPDEFPEPDELILDRDPNRHVGFGVGHHRCLGANLARMEIRVSIEQVLRRLPDFRLSAEHEAVYRHGRIPGYSSIPVEFTPGPRRFAADATS